VGVLITAAPSVLAERLAARGRTFAAAIAERLKREVPLPDDPAIHRIDNGGALEVAGTALLRLIAAG
jgi:ribose 1,5-bisphosphokinase